MNGPDVANRAYQEAVQIVLQKERYFKSCWREKKKIAQLCIIIIKSNFYFLTVTSLINWLELRCSSVPKQRWSWLLSIQINAPVCTGLCSHLISSQLRCSGALRKNMLLKYIKIHLYEKNKPYAQEIIIIWVEITELPMLKVHASKWNHPLDGGNISNWVLLCSSFTLQSGDFWFVALVIFRSSCFTFSWRFQRFLFFF